LVQLTSCSDCCETVIGKLTRTGGPDNQSVDAAIAELEVGVKWLPRVHGIPIVGTLDLSLAKLSSLPVPVQNALRDVKFFVKKYGAVTGLTTGVIGNIDGKSETRIHQLQVWSIGEDEFSAVGDSGSVIYVDNSKDNDANVVQQIFGSPPVKNPNRAKVVGLLWGGAVNKLTTGNTVHISSCGHIETVTDLLGIKIATNSPEVVYEVGGEPKPHPAWARVYTDLSGTEHAKELVTLYGKYSEEIGDLLKLRRHFVVAWHRNHGPKIVRAVIDVAENRAPFLPTGFEGQSWSDCVQQIAHALLEEGSSALKADVIRYLPLATRFGGRSYAEVLGFLVVSDITPVAIETGPVHGTNI